MIADGISSELSEEPQYVFDRHTYRKKREKNEIGISSIRGGTIVGEHEVIFAGHDEVVNNFTPGSVKGSIRSRFG